MHYSLVFHDKHTSDHVEFGFRRNKNEGKRFPSKPPAVGSGFIFTSGVVFSRDVVWSTTIGAEAAANNASRPQCSTVCEGKWILELDFFSTIEDAYFSVSKCVFEKKWKEKERKRLL